MISSRSTELIIRAEYGRCGRPYDSQDQPG